MPQGERASGCVHDEAQQQPPFVLRNAVGELAIGGDREGVDLDDLGEIDVPGVFIGKPDVRDLKALRYPRSTSRR